MSAQNHLPPFDRSAASSRYVGSTTASELDLQIDRLRAEGMDKLLLDLRGNPGGLLDQAVQVSERFIEAGDLIVYTRGRIHGSKADYVAKRGVERWTRPLVLLLQPEIERTLAAVGVG